MAVSKSRVVANVKSAFRLKAEEEARLVVSEAESTADLRAAARAKAKEEAEIWVAAAKAAAKAREEAIAAEEARIDATGKDEWFYLQNGEQSGPLSLVELRGKISDASIEPPINLVWTEGMDGWKPVYKIRRVCAPIASKEVETDQGAGKPEQPQSEGVAGVKAAAEAQAATAKAAEEARLQMAAEAQAAAAKAAEEARLRMAAEAQAAAAKAAEEARLRMAAEAQAAAAKAAEEARLRMAAEAKAAEAKAAAEVKLRMAAEAKAAAETRLRALAEARAAEEAKLRAATEAKAAEEVKLRMAAEAKAAAETRLRALAEARATEEARRAVAAKSKAEKEARAKATEEARRAAAAISKAEKEARAKAAEEAKRLAAAEAKAVKKAGPVGAAATSVWFYTCEGERQGPVAFEELRAMAACSSLDPRLDLVWNSDMDTWKPAGQIEGLFEQRTLHVETNRTPARPAISHRSPQRGSRTQKGGIIPWPGVRRRKLLLVTLIFPFAWQFALGTVSPFLVKEFGQVLMGRILPVAALVPLVVLVHFGLRRLVNLGMSRWWYLAVFAPIVNLWLGYRCFACPPGYAYHKKMDAPGIALAIPYWLIMLAGVVILASNPARFYGMIDSPKLQKQLHTVIRMASSPGRLLRD